MHGKVIHLSDTIETGFENGLTLVFVCDGDTISCQMMQLNEFRILLEAMAAHNTFINKK